MGKVLIIQSVLPQYRIPIFNMLAESCELTVLVPESPKDFSDINFKVIVQQEKHIRRLGRYFKCNLKKTIDEFDVCIAPLSINYPQVIKYLFGRRKAKTVLWGIGVSAGYGVPYDSNKKYRRMLRMLIHKADAALFYSSYPIAIYTDMGIIKEKLFVANNTVEVKHITDKTTDYLLFVGSLYPAKGVDVLINQYYEAFLKQKDIDDLYIVGDGTERTACEYLCTEKGISDKVHFLGSIYDENYLSEVFSHAVACISPNQAGLSVLKAMGYGVPFITKESSITGGERFNIVNNVNGVLYREDEDLKDIIVDIKNNREKYIQMGILSKEHYEKKRSVKTMVNGFIDAIDFVAVQGD